MHALQTCRGEVTFYGNTRRTATCTHYRRVEAMSRFTATPGEQPHVRTLDVSRRCHVLRQHQENSHMHALQTCRGDVTFYGNTRRTATCTPLRRVEAMSGFTATPREQPHAQKCVEAMHWLIRPDTPVTWEGIEPTTPRIRQDPGALPLSYHDLMRIRAKF